MASPPPDYLSMYVCPIQHDIPQCLIWCLVYSRHSVNIYWMNDWNPGWCWSFFSVLLHVASVRCVLWARFLNTQKEDSDPSGISRRSKGKLILTWLRSIAFLFHVWEPSAHLGTFLYLLLCILILSSWKCLSLELKSMKEAITSKPSLESVFIFFRREKI